MNKLLDNSNISDGLFSGFLIFRGFFVLATLVSSNKVSWPLILLLFIITNKYDFLLTFWYWLDSAFVPFRIIDFSPWSQIVYNSSLLSLKNHILFVLYGKWVFLRIQFTIISQKIIIFTFVLVLVTSNLSNMSHMNSHTRPSL